VENEMVRLQVFSIGAHQFAVPANEIATVCQWRAPAPLPRAPESVMGVVTVQGRMLTVLDLAALTGSAGNSRTPHQIVALRGDEQLALAVDSVNGEVDVKIEDENNELVSAVFSHDNSNISVINVKQLFPTAIQGRERRKRQF
jgi:chemotaxis signal transduction protein